MKRKLYELVCPSDYHYSTIAERAFVLHKLMQSAINFRRDGRWESDGPSEILNSHHGCTNSGETEWTSDRNGLTTWDEHRECLRDTLLRAICSQDPLVIKWRASIDLTLTTQFNFPIRKIEYSSTEEESAWKSFIALDRIRLPGMSFNSCHRAINTLCFPQLVISRHGINVQIEVTTATELRESGGCASRWTLGFLLDEQNANWSPGKETFVEFLNRSVAFIKSRDAKIHRARN